MYQNYQSQNTGSFGSLPYGANTYGNQASSFPNHSHMQSSTSSSSIQGQENSLGSRMDERSALNLLQHLGKDELKLLHENDSKLQDLINDLPQVKNIQDEHDNLVISNKSIAEYNLSLQPKLEELKQTVALGYERQNALKNSLAEDKAKLDSFVSQQSLDTLLALLQTETAKVEEESENLTSDFYDSSVEMEDYVNQFLSKRTTMHLRRIRSERMAELIREGQHGGNVSHSTNHSPYPPRGDGPIGAPYPSSGHFNMPQPRLPYR